MADEDVWRELGYRAGVRGSQSAFMREQAEAKLAARRAVVVKWILRARALRRVVVRDVMD